MLDEAAPRTTQMEHHHHALEQIWHIAARLDLLRITAGPEMEALGVDFKHVRQVLEAAQARSCVAPSTMRSSSRRSPHEDFRPWRCSRRDRELGRRGGPGGYVGLVTGRLTLDLGVGRRIQPLGHSVSTSSPLQS